MWPFRKKMKPVWFQVVKPAGETYFVIRRMGETDWEYLYHFKKEHRSLSTVEYSWHCKSHATATRYDDKQEAIDTVKLFNEFDQVVAEWHNPYDGS
jgi:hypothetical protein